MHNRPLENILLGDFGLLQKTLQGNGYAPRRTFSNHYVVYELRRPDPGLNLKGAYLAVRKSACGGVENAILGTAVDLPTASSAIMDLPIDNDIVKYPAPSWPNEALKAGVPGLAGAGIASILMMEPPAVVGGFLLGAACYFKLHEFRAAINSLYCDFLHANSSHYSQGRLHASSGFFIDAIEGKEAIRAMLELTEIYSARA